MQNSSLLSAKPKNLLVNPRQSHRSTFDFRRNWSINFGIRIRRRFFMKASANIGGHPIHTMLIPFPIGLWVFAMAADIIFMWRGNPAWRSVAFYCIAGGIVGAALAAVFGLIDLLGVKDDPKVFRIGLMHGGFNVAALVVFVLNLYLRTNAGAQMVGAESSVPLALSVIGVLILCVSGWLGGELVFRHGMGVDARPEADPTGETSS